MYIRMYFVCIVCECTLYVHICIVCTVRTYICTYSLYVYKCTSRYGICIVSIKDNLLREKGEKRKTAAEGIEGFESLSCQFFSFLLSSLAGCLPYSNIPPTHLLLYGICIVCIYIIILYVLYICKCISIFVP